jgi:hypothetical protein
VVAVVVAVGVGAMNARIGRSGKAVHRLAQYESPATHGRLYQWGASLCGLWAGEARATGEAVTCRACLRAEAQKAARREARG